MGTISDKLTYLTETKSQLKDTINLTGASITNDTFRSYPSKLYKQFIDLINNGTDNLYENLPKVTGTGSNIELNGTTECKMKLGYLGGNTEQTTYTGKNLFDENTEKTRYYYDANGNLINGGQDYITQEIPLSNQYTVSFSVNHSSYVRIVEFGVNDTFISRNMVSTSPTTITLNANTTKVIVNVDADLSQNKYFENLQIEQGSTATPYEPYVGGTPSPNPNYPQEVRNVVGVENLLNFDYTSQTISGVTITINKDKSITLNGTSTEGIGLYSNNAIILKAGTYTHSVNQIQNGLFCSLNNITTTMLNGNNGEKVKTFTISEDTTYSRYLIYINSGKTFNNYTLKLQLEPGSIQHDYVPYGHWARVKVKGKNLFDKDNANIIDCLINGSTNTISSYNGTKTLYIPITGGKTYTVSKKISARFVVGSCVDTPANNVQCTNVTQNNTSNSITLTTGSTDNYLCVFYFLNGTDTLTEQEILDSIQIEYGSTATPYQPYQEQTELLDLNIYDNQGNIIGHNELCKIGDYKDYFRKSTGKNLFDKSNANILNAYIDQNQSSIVSLNTTSSIWIPCKSNTKYTVSKTSSTRFKVGSAISYQSGTILTVITGANSDTQTTITTGSNDKFLIVFYYNSGSDTLTEEQIRNSIQIEEGSTATTYEPYGKVWYLHKAIGKVVLDGTNTNFTNRYTTNTNNKYRFVVSTTGFIPFTSASTAPPIYCDKLSSTSIENNYRCNQGISINGSSNELLLYINEIASYSVNDANTWLESNNITAYIPLATPTYEIITNQSVINSLEAIASMLSYEDTTYVISTDDIPMIMDVSAVRQYE